MALDDLQTRDDIPEDMRESIGHEISTRKLVDGASELDRDNLETITRTIGAGLCIISRDYRTLWANGVLKRIFGDVEGQPCYSAYNRRGEVCPNCGVRQIFETGADEVRHEEVGKDKNGQTIWSSPRSRSSSGPTSARFNR